MVFQNLASVSGRALLFDLDDTLVDSGGVKRRIFGAALTQCSIESSQLVDDFMKMSGAPLFEVCDKLGLPREVPLLYRELASEVRREIGVFPGVLETIGAFYEQGVPMGIVTGRDRVSSLEVLENTGLSVYFQTLVTPDDINSSKPSPGPLFYACGLLKSVPIRSVFAGDSIADMKSAQAAGLIGLGCTWSGIAKSELLEAGASSVVETVDKLQEAIAKLLLSGKRA